MSTKRTGMSDQNAPTRWLKHSSFTRSSSLTLPRLKGTLSRALNEMTTQCTNHKASESSNPVIKQMAPPAVQRSEGRAKVDHTKPSAPWENNHAVM
ncbi:hypothetical protein ATANTOWER_028775 [Ataeniobius toweri]|uniref:Uncharacterized protein n=1 Tax=Ataeniobius toweri TaxID=208326 RepID=A0ABU7B8Y4_9TELE|nr:hypothetical protein [Ataeniobius toweri]